MADSFQLKAIISAVDKMSPTLKNITRSIKITNKAFRDIGSAGSKLMASVGLPAGLAFGTAAYAAVNATRAALDYASSIQDAADRTGASAESFQTLSNMLGQVGGTTEDAEAAFTKFNKGAAEAAAGVDKSFAGLMQKLKIPLKDAKGNVRSLTDVLPELADGFAKNTNPATQTRMAMELFGKGGAKMIPILKGGGDAVRAWVKEQERLGAVLGGDAVNNLDDLGDSAGFLSKQIKTQWTSAVASMAPTIMPLIKQMTEWIAANKELIQANITGVLTDITSSLKNVDWVAFMQGIRDTIKQISGFVDRVGGMKNILLGLGIAFLAGPLSAIIQIGTALSRVGLLLLTNPIGLIMAGIAAAGYLVYTNWDKLSPLFDVLVQSVSGLGAELMNLWNVLEPVILPVLKVVGAVLGYVFIKIIQGSIDAVTAFINVLAGVFKYLAKFAAWVMPDWVKGLLGGDSKIAIKQTTSAAKPLQPALKQIAAANPAPSPGSPSQPSLAQNMTRLAGELVVRFENAPAGMRASPGKTNQPGVTLNPDVGYRTFTPIAGFRG